MNVGKGIPVWRILTFRAATIENNIEVDNEMINAKIVIKRMFLLLENRYHTRRTSIAARSVIDRHNMG